MGYQCGFWSRNYWSDTGEKWEYNGTMQWLFTCFRKTCASGEMYCIIFSLNLLYQYSQLNKVCSWTCLITWHSKVLRKSGVTGSGFKNEQFVLQLPYLKKGNQNIHDVMNPRYEGSEVTTCQILRKGMLKCTAVIKYFKIANIMMKEVFQLKILKAHMQFLSLSIVLLKNRSYNYYFSFKKRWWNISIPIMRQSFKVLFYFSTWI